MHERLLLKTVNLGGRIWQIVETLRSGVMIWICDTGFSKGFEEGFSFCKSLLNLAATSVAKFPI